MNSRQCLISQYQTIANVIVIAKYKVMVMVKNIANLIAIIIVMLGISVRFGYCAHRLVQEQQICCDLIFIINVSCQLYIIYHFFILYLYLYCIDYDIFDYLLFIYDCEISCYLMILFILQLNYERHELYFYYYVLIIHYDYDYDYDDN